MSNFAELLITLAVVVALGAALCAWRPRAAPLIGAGAAIVAALLVGWMWWTVTPARIDLPWFQPTGSRLVLGMDPLGAPMAVFSAVLAAVTLLYTAGYLPRHLSEHGHHIREQGRFCVLMLGFMATMLLLVMVGDLIVLFGALELTALMSFLLIGFDRDDPQARRAARVALVVTAGSSLLFLLGALSIAVDQGTTVIAEIRPERVSAIAAGCLIAGVLAKSAQMPLHFWLPRAMVAPTPVSAYLHSAALVAAGVFVALRLRPLMAGSPGVLTAMVWIGLASALIGGLLALSADGLKSILAYSTIAQYGHVLALIGLGGDHGLVGAAFFLFAHGVCKSALFLTAGAVTSANGTDRLSNARGNWRDLPVLAAVSAIAAAGLAGLPLTVGYFKEELFFATAAGRGPGTVVVATAAAALTVAYIGRFWIGVFGNRERAAPALPMALLVLPVALLAGVVLVAGIVVDPLARVSMGAGTIAAGHRVSAEIAYHLEPRVELWMTAAAWALGGVLLWRRRDYTGRLAAGLSRLSARLGPATLAAGLDDVSTEASDWLHRMELRDLRDRIASVLIPAAALIALGIIATGRLAAPVGPFSWHDIPLAAALLTTAAAALIVVRARDHMDIILLLSFVGFALAVTFSIARAPEVALVVVIIETLLTMLFVTLFTQIPKPQSGAPNPAERADARRPRHTRRGVWIAVVAGISAFWVAWFSLGERFPEATAQDFVAFAELAHAGDAVSAIIADFRGLDTLVEITVLGVAILGALSITRGRAR